jgi:transcriptional regulator with XRE-family HTH domain
MNKDDRATQGMIGKRIREARRMAGLSQKQLATLLKLHRPSVSEIEAGNRRVAAEELRRIADFLDVSISWILGENAENIEDDDPRIQLAAREFRRLKPADFDRILKVLAAIKR